MPFTGPLACRECGFVTPLAEAQNWRLPGDSGTHESIPFSVENVRLPLVSHATSFRSGWRAWSSPSPSSHWRASRSRGRCL